MASYTILKNESITIDLPSDIADQGWVVSGGTASHSGCNSGYIERMFDLSEAEEWTFRYTIPSITSGVIIMLVDGQTGETRTTPGTYEETFEVTGPVLVRFFSDGVNQIEFLKVFKAVTEPNSVTVAFSEDANRWVGYYSYKPEFMVKFINDFFVFRNGELWEQNVNPLRNNFFGVQYTSKIEFYCNLNPTQVKIFHSMREKSNKAWSAPELLIYPYYGKPEGQLSRLKKGRFRSLQGDWFSDFLRDMNDPRYLTEEEALFKGAELQGSLMKVTIENSDTVEVRLLSVDILVSPSDYTY